jgi:3-methyladenine DNA glycosylase AlkD
MTAEYQIKEIIKDIETEISNLPTINTANVRQVRREFSKRLNKQAPEFMLQLARELNNTPRLRWFGYELVRYHKDAYKSLGVPELEALGQGISSWHDVDEFARILAGPAWLAGQIPDSAIEKWAYSADLWWRRAALVSTVALNMRSHGGPGDIPRTLHICRILVDDHEDMVVKAMSWALRELIVHDPEVVENFLQEYDDLVAARVKREVRNKLNTGLKNPKSKA